MISPAFSRDFLPCDLFLELHQGRKLINLMISAGFLSVPADGPASLQTRGLERAGSRATDHLNSVACMAWLMILPPSYL